MSAQSQSVPKSDIRRVMSDHLAIADMRVATKRNEVRLYSLPKVGSILMWIKKQGITGTYGLLIFKN